MRNGLCHRHLDEDGYRDRRLHVRGLECHCSALTWARFARRLILYIAIYGWCVLNNWIETTLSDAWKHVLKMAIVFAVATSWGWFHMFFYDVFVNGPDSFIASLTGGDTSRTGLDNVFDTGFKAANKIFEASQLVRPCTNILSASWLSC